MDDARPSQPIASGALTLEQPAKRVWESRRYGFRRCRRGRLVQRRCKLLGPGDQQLFQNDAAVEQAGEVLAANG